MNPPAGSIRAELNEAVVGGIRQRGPEAVGVVLIGVAHLVVAFIALTVLLFATLVLGFEISAVPVLLMSALSGVVSWLVGKKSGWPFPASLSVGDTDESGEDSGG
jgi:hypothetical protein